MADILNKLNSANYVTVKITDNAITNGNNLIATYASAKAKTPNGSALSASNRLAIILPPAIYDLGTQSLTLDTQYIDIIGSTNERGKHHIKSNVATTSSGVIRQTANDVKLINLKIENTGYYGVAFNSTDAAAYFPDSNLNNTYVENVEFRGYRLLNAARTLSMRRNIEYSGTFIDCKATDGANYSPEYSFGGSGSGAVASGTFKNCEGGNNSFGGGTGGVASGTFINCTAGLYSFGGHNSSGGVASGTFEDCIGGDYAFGGNGTASGSFKNCTGGLGAFGGEFGVATGKFENCKGGNFAFGGNLASGTFINCEGGDYSFCTYGVINGIFINCRGGTSSFNIN